MYIFVIEVIVKVKILHMKNVTPQTNVGYLISIQCTYMFRKDTDEIKHRVD